MFNLIDKIMEKTVSVFAGVVSDAFKVTDAPPDSFQCHCGSAVPMAWHDEKCPGCGCVWNIAERQGLGVIERGQGSEC